MIVRYLTDGEILGYALIGGSIPDEIPDGEHYLNWNGIVVCKLLDPEDPPSFVSNQETCTYSVSSSSPSAPNVLTDVSLPLNNSIELILAPRPPSTSNAKLLMLGDDIYAAEVDGLGISATKNRFDTSINVNPQSDPASV